MSRPVKPTLVSPVKGQAGFGEAASEALLNIQPAMDFVDASNAYQQTFSTTATNTKIVGDRTEQGITLANARKLLFVNADGDGLTTNVPPAPQSSSSAIIRDGFMQTKMVYHPRLLDVFGHTQGFRYIELNSDTPTPTVGEGGYPGDRYGSWTGGNTGNLEYGLFNVRSTMTTFRTVIRARRDFTVGIVDRTRLGEGISNGFISFKGEGTTADIYGTVVGGLAPEMRTVDTGSSGGLYFIEISIDTTAGDNPTLCARVGRFGMDDYINAFSIENGYESTKDGHPNLIINEEITAGDVSRGSTDAYPAIRIPTAGDPIRIFHREVQWGNSFGLAYGAQN